MLKEKLWILTSGWPLSLRAICRTRSLLTRRRGFNPAGAEFDAKIQELLSSRNTTGLLNLDPTLVQNASECGFRSLLILVGVLRNMDYTYRQYSYEAPFGVGYLTANFII